MKSLLRTRPLVIASAPNGAEYNPSVNPSIPVTPAEALRDAARVYEEGARYIHLHPREPRSGDQFMDAEWFKAVRAGFADAAPDAALSFASSRKGHVAQQILSSIAAAELMTPQLTVSQLVDSELIRAVGMHAQPDLMTIFTALETRILGADEDDSAAAAGSYKGSTQRGYTDPAVIQAYYSRVRDLYAARNIAPEYEVTTMGALWTLDNLARRHTIPENPHFIFLFGFSERMPVSRSMFDLSMAFVRHLKNVYGLRPVVSAGAVIRPHQASAKPRAIGEPVEPGKHDYLELLQWIFQNDDVDCIRVGLEDTPVQFGVKPCNADLVRLIRTECHAVGLPVLTDRERIKALFRLRR